jgi:DNA helicase HerA-like ATPase
MVFDTCGAAVIKIGKLQQDTSIEAAIKVDDMLGKHFALLGSTGVGKSSGVAVLLRAILEVRPNLRIFQIDPHNEYGHSFRERAQILTPKNLKLPFWLFNFEETVDVFFRGRPGLEDEVEILSQVIPQAKNLFAAARGAEGQSLRKVDSSHTGYTVDTPVPYRLADLVSLIDERMGKLENRSSTSKFSRLVARIETVRQDPRYAFMFDNANVGGDTMAEVVGQLFRLPANGKPMTVMQLAGFPSEVVDSVVSVLGRMAFDFGLWSDGAVPLLFVCEEAHRYAPGDKSIGFGPTRKAISRIAKEGRKYGVFLGMVTQRPAELDATIISQCNTLFVMRMANERDQNIIRSAVSDAAASLLAFLPSLGTREVFAFGEGVALPTRLRFSELPTHMIPRSESELSVRIDSNRGVDSAFIHSVVERWRGATMGNKRKLGEATAEPGKPAGEWGAFVTEAEQPLLAAATRPINAQSAVRASLLRK